MPGCQEPGPLAELADTVKPYGRHVLVAGGKMRWPEKIEAADGLLGTIARDVSAMGDVVTPKPKVTALLTEPSGGARGGAAVDLLVYPDTVAYRGVTAETWPAIRDAHLARGAVVRNLRPDPLAGTDLLVCVHGARDQRCGNCGPLVAAAIRKGIEARGLADVRVHLTSHVGGHKYAGNVIAYPDGAWYGYVRPGDVDELLDHVVRGDVWARHLRGLATGTRT